jgi:hypothetical protein
MEECIICFYDKPIEDYICFSCGHKVCSTCYPLMNNVCPICRYAEVDLMSIEIVIPRQIATNDLPDTNYVKILLNTLCACLTCIIIYIVIVVPIQTLS